MLTKFFLLVINVINISKCHRIPGDSTAMLLSTYYHLFVEMLVLLFLSFDSVFKLPYIIPLRFRLGQRSSGVVRSFGFRSQRIAL